MSHSAISDVDAAGTPPAGAIVIGWGQDLRGDDAAGHLVAERLREQALPGLRIETVRLLTPELAYDLARNRVAVLIDADATAETLRVERVQPSGAPRGAVTHALTAGQLVALCEAVYGVRPRVWLVGVPAESFELGDPLSVRTSEAIEGAVTAVIEALEREDTEDVEGRSLPEPQASLQV